MILDGGPCKSGIESTVIDCRQERPTLLRPGPLTPKQIADQTGIELQISKPLEQASQAVSPGQIESHYAPRASVRLNAENKLQDEIYIGFGPSKTGLMPDFNLSEQANLVEAASNLFAILHEADALETAAIAFAPIPMAGLGLAINDRISRAAAPRTF